MWNDLSFGRSTQTGRCFHMCNTSSEEPRDFYLQSFFLGGFKSSSEVPNMAKWVKDTGVPLKKARFGERKHVLENGGLGFLVDPKPFSLIFFGVWF